jgi:Interferon-induced 6-16 family
MATNDVSYRVRVRIDQESDEDRLVSINEATRVPAELRKQWVEKITEYIWAPGGRNQSRDAIRPWDFILNPDGSIESLPVAHAENELSSGLYPARHRIPPSSIDTLTQQDQIDRQERFAFGTLLYQVALGKKLFEGLSDEEVQQRYRLAEFPDDVETLHPSLFIAILSLWSLEFAKASKSPRFRSHRLYLTAAVNPPRSTFARIGVGAKSYVKAHPYLFALQVGGALCCTAAAVTPALLGAVGFGALGPIAGSAAAGWQASMGIVEAGSIFAWCQSAAIGGAAASTVFATGAAGAGVAALATGAGALQRETATADAQQLLTKFREVYRKENSTRVPVQDSTD